MAEQRLIDANAFKDCWKPGVIGDTMQRVIDEQPTIDPETLPIVQQLRAELKQVTAERDAAMSFIPKTCTTCKYGNSPCDWCVNDPDGDMNREWNGKAKEDCNDQP